VWCAEMCCVGFWGGDEGRGVGEASRFRMPNLTEGRGGGGSLFG
jgi:hypothetical protein